MRTLQIPVLLALTSVVVAISPVGAATLIGTQVTGALYFQGFPDNYFDPVNGRVPPGYLNAAGTTVTISANAVEFGFADPTAIVTADFDAAQLTIIYQPLFTAHYNPVQLAFTNSAFSSLSTVSDGFPNGGMASLLSGNVISLNWAGGDMTAGQNLQAVFNVNLPAAPRLSIQLTPTNAVVISWPAPSTDFNLQQNNSVNSTNWVNVTITPIVANGLKQVIVSPPVGKQFYRLKYP
jgi:hypothetical protein